MRVAWSLILDNSVTVIHSTNTRSLSDRESLTGSLLLRQSNLLLVGSGNLTGLLNNVELDVAVGSEVGRDSSVGSVSSSSALNSSLGANVRDLALLDIKTLGLGVALEVGEESEDVLNRLLGPSSVVMVDVLAHSMSSRATGVSSEGDDTLVLQASLEVGEGLHEVQASASSGSLVSVLVVCSQVVHSA